MNPGTPSAPATVALVATARPTFALDAARDLLTRARALLTELGADIFGPEDLVMTPDDLEAALADQRADVDLVLNICATFSDASPALRLYDTLDRPLLLWSFREPGPVGDRLWLNSLCGANLFGHAVVRSGGQVRLLHGDPEEDEVRETLAAALRGTLPDAVFPPSVTRARGPESEARAALDGLQGKRIGVIGDPPTGFTPSEYDPELLERVFGLQVERIEVQEAFARTRAVSESDCAAERESATRAQPSLAALDPVHVERLAGVTSALRGWREEATLSAVAVRCWPEFPTELGVCPCSALSRLANEATPTACERDVYGTVTMLLMEALGSGTTYLVDTVDLDTRENLVRLWHCGSAATSLAADPQDAHQSVHCNRRIGVAGDFPLATGRVVMARLTEDRTTSSGLRLLLAAGESLPEPNRFQGNTAAVRLDGSARDLVHGLVSGGFPHHTVVAWTDVRPGLRAAADQLHIPVIEW